MLAPGQVIGEYEVLRALSEGGMGRLFVARRTGAQGFTRDVAVKVLPSDLSSDPSFQQRFTFPESFFTLSKGFFPFGKRFFPLQDCLGAGRKIIGDSL